MAKRDVEQVNFRVNPEEKAALEKLVQRRAEETGDDTLTGWFRAVLRKEARAAGVRIGAAIKLPDGCTCSGAGECAACVRVLAEASLKMARRAAEIEGDDDKKGTER